VIDSRGWTDSPSIKGGVGIPSRANKSLALLADNTIAGGAMDWNPGAQTTGLSNHSSPAKEIANHGVSTSTRIKKALAELLRQGLIQ